MLVLLKKWHPLFDASRERVDVVPTWVKLLSLSLPFWTEEHFMHIGNLLGSFLEADYSEKSYQSEEGGSHTRQYQHKEWASWGYEDFLEGVFTPIDSGL